ncbi:MAG: cytochrome B [Candidatus Niyogibacteria bacterium CG10_big_fil_rev_8_21_14_0_10_42_19]|uniref:Cytochrome B n=1 Tax=Candidatus Niyogibacteria bacterium CG10_big_fil_rev_8_21_14_0_10_42_19 TaxID=1974725 RepID=A0A2H0THP4_9BACT|nr:MAG: cytochrome B [Candidatus Niyogibacteria bacterium CG10_big_fil_rev_8_21_14_0_10_42_19]
MLFSRIYQWTLAWVHRRHSSWALGVLSFAESSFFPIPPDPLLMILVALRPARWWKYAIITTSASVVGGAFAYFIGFVFYETAGKLIIESYGLTEQVAFVGKYYSDNLFFAVFGAAFTPIPYKVFTISAGLFKTSFWVFMAASFLGRSLRFFLVSLLMYVFGLKMEKFIKKYFGILSLMFFILLVAGFVVIKLYL